MNSADLSLETEAPNNVFRFCNNNDLQLSRKGQQRLKTKGTNEKHIDKNNIMILHLTAEEKNEF